MRFDGIPSVAELFPDDVRESEKLLINAKKEQAQAERSAVEVAKAEQESLKKDLDAQKANVDALYNQSEKLRFLIGSLVKLSRLENGIISLTPQHSALQPLLQGIVEQYAAKAAEKGLSLQLHATDVSATFDSKWTAEALVNIVDNAIKYTEQGTITISVVSYEMFARIDISDTGAGIAESEQSKIFARFYRSKVVWEQEGVGIGLYLARQIISGEGGYIKISSVPGKGSTFSVFLPK